MKTFAVLAAIALSGMMNFSVMAEPPPSLQPLYHLTTVRWVVNTKDNMDVDDRYVTLVGRVTHRISDEEYWFTDGT